MASESLHAPDLTDWILNMQCLKGSCGEYSYRRWKKTRSLPWLVAALANADADSGHARALIEAGSTVPDASPAFETVQFHRFRLMIAIGAGAPAREGLDRMLADPAVPKSSANAFRALRMRTAPNVEGFLRFALRPPVMITWSMNEGEVPIDWPAPKGYSLADLRFDRDSVKILNERTPLRLLAEAALGDAVPEYLRRDFVLNTFTRAVLLEDEATARKLATRLGELSPELREYSDTYVHAGEPDRKFASTFLLLHAPEARPYYASGAGRQAKPGKIENYRDNWWCPLTVKWDLGEIPYEGGLGGDHRTDPDLAARGVEFLSDADRLTAREEFKKLAASGAGPDVLGAVVLRHAREHPNDARVSEALHLSVRAARYGCDRIDVGLTRDTFRLLHTRYPDSPWTRKTATWR